MANVNQKRIIRSPERKQESIVDTDIKPEIKDDLETAPNPLSWLTLEILLWGLILVLGVTLRLWHLGQVPLSDVEAQQSLAALQLYEGGSPEPGDYSPLLVSITSLIFLIFQDSDASARLLSVLFGAALILLPMTLRRQLGAPVCLLTSALLALSPIALFLSRTLNSEIAVATGALMLFSGFFNWVEDGRQRWLYLAAGGLAIMLTAGPMAYSVIVVFGLIVLIRLPAFKKLWQLGVAHTETVRTSPQAGQPDSKNKTPKSEPKNFSQTLQQAGIFLLVALLLLSTAATFNLSGASVAVNQLTDWISRFTFQPRLDSGYNAVFLLTIYDILIVLAGLVGLTYALLSRTPLKLTLAGWFLGALALDLVMVGRPLGSVILSLVPLAFLAAIALAELWRSLQSRGTWANEGIILGAGIVIFGFGYIGLTGWLARVCAEGDRFCQLAWLQSVAALSLFLVIVAFFWFVQNDPSMALRGLALTAVVLSLIATIGFGWRLNYGPLRNLAYQPLAGVPASTELVALTETLSSESLIRTGDQRQLDITVIGTTPALLWQLRHYENLSEINLNTEAPGTPAIITLANETETESFNLGEAYIGQDFALNAFWSPVGLPPKELINWLIYRETSQSPQRGNVVVLWLRLNG